MGWPNNFVQGVYNALGSLIGLSDGAGGQIGLAATYTWATKPLASAYIGTAFITDIGQGGSYWVSNGTEWKPLNGSVVLASSAVASSAVTGDSGVDHAVASLVLPAGIMGLNGRIEVYAKFTATIVTTVTTLYLKLGGTTLWGVGYGLFASSTGISSRCAFQNRNSASSQLASLGNITDVGGTNAALFVKPAVNTAISQTLELIINAGNAASTHILESYTVILTTP